MHQRIYLIIQSHLLFPLTAHQLMYFYSTNVPSQVHHFAIKTLAKNKPDPEVSIPVTSEDIANTS